MSGDLKGQQDGGNSLWGPGGGCKMIWAWLQTEMKKKVKVGHDWNRLPEGRDQKDLMVELWKLGRGKERE